MASERLFSALKLIGALYLFYLACSRAGRRHVEAPAAREIEALPSPTFQQAVRPSVHSGGSNPKDMLFFAAFLPQFLNAGQPLLPQLLVMT